MQNLGWATNEDLLGQVQTVVPRFEVAADAKEMLNDGGLEVWTTSSNLTHWIEYVDSGCSVARESTIKHGGSYSAKMTSVDGVRQVAIYQLLYLPYAADYVLSFWYYAPTGKNVVMYLVESSWTIGLNTSGQWSSEAYGVLLAGNGAWQNYSVSFKGLAGFTLFQLRFANSGSVGYSYYIDDVSLVAKRWVDLSQSPAQEALIDGNLEYWLSSSNLTFWSEVPGTGTVTRAGSAGAYNARVLCAAGGALCRFHQTVQLPVLHRYTLSFWYKTVVGAGQFYMMNTTTSRYLKSDGTWSATTSYYIDLPSTGGAWTKFTLPIVTDDVGEFYNCSFGAAGANYDVYFDEISLRPDPSYLKSMSCSVAGAGPSTEPLAGSWSVSLADPEHVFNPCGASPWAGLIRLGREARLSWGVQLGSYLRFDGTNDYVDVADNAALDITSALTIECWVRQTTRTSWATLVTKGTSTSWASNNYTLGLRSGRVDFRWGSNTLLADVGTELRTTDWYHIVAVVPASGQITVWVNGVLRSYLTRSVTPTANAQPLRFGSDDGSTNNLNGRIADVRIYNRDLSAAEVVEHYAQRFGSETGLVGHWPMSERSGSVVEDAGPNGLDGTVYGATWARPQYLANETLESWASATDANGWVEQTAGSSTVERESTVVHGGAYSVKFTVVDGRAAYMYQAFTKETLPPGKTYRFGGWYRTDGTARARLYVYAAPGYAWASGVCLTGQLEAPHWVSGVNQVIVLPAVSDWTRFDVLFTLPPQFDTFLFIVGGDSNGVSYFDDLEVVPVEAEAEALVWQRVVGFMDSPRFDLAAGDLSISGTDYMKVLTDTKLFSPWVNWGTYELFDSVASPSGTGSEIYAEADACEIGAGEADNVTNWTVGGGGGAVSSEEPAPDSDYFLLFTRDAGPWVNEYAHNSNVGSVTAGNTYKVTFQAVKTGKGSAVVRVYQTVGSTAVLLGTKYISPDSWIDYEMVVNVTATGALQMRVESYGKYAADGDTISLDNISIKLFDSSTWNQYEMPEACNGVYYVELDGKPVWQGDEDGQGGWHYYEDLNILFFSDELVINAGTDNLRIYYYVDTAPEDVVADLLVAGNRYTTRAAAKAAMNYTATGITIPRVWFEPGTPALDAVRLICERVNYRFWFSADGTPNFVPAPTKTTPAHFDLPALSQLTYLTLYQDIEEVRNHVTIEGDERSVLNVSTGKVERSTWKSTDEDPDSILLYQRKTYSLNNHLFQDQTAVDNMVAALLAYYKDPKFYVDMGLTYLPAPLAVGDTVSFLLPTGGGTTAAKQGIVRSLSLNDFETQLLLELCVPFDTLLTVQDATLALLADTVTLDYPGTLSVQDATLGMSAEQPALRQVFTYTTTQAGTSRAVPSGATQAIIECWGSGGDGGDGEMVGRAGGGGGGAYSKKTVTVEYGQTLTLYLSNDNDTYVVRSGSTLCLAKCGNPGDLTGGGAGGAAASGTGDVKYSGGNGYFYATGYTGGGGGSSAGTAANGNNATSSTGANAPTGGGDGGNGGGRYNNGEDGKAPGGGGGGAGQDLSYERHGGAGALGKIRITFS